MTLLSVLAAFVVLMAVSYGGYMFWTWVFTQVKKSSTKINGAVTGVVTTAFVLASGGGAFAQSSTPTINFDLTPFFDSLNAYLPVFLALFGIVGGIAGAMALSRYIIGAVVRAFNGGSI